MYAGGDLEVTITEAGGRTDVHRPLCHGPLLQREGSTRYSLTAGHFRSTGNGYDDPGFIQGSLLWGLPYNVTLYGGTQYAPHYQAGAAGLGLNMGRWGALSSDVTVAESVWPMKAAITATPCASTTVRLSAKPGPPSHWPVTVTHLTVFTTDDTALKRMSGWRYDTDEDGNIVRSPDTGISPHGDASARPLSKMITGVKRCPSVRQSHSTMNATAET